MTTPPNTSGRRRFLQAALAAGAAPLLLPSHSWGASANGKINMAFIGMGKQSGGLLPGFLGQQELVQVVAVCDVDTTRREIARKRAVEFYKSKGREEKVDAYNDFREVLARPDVDAVCIATPDHWHAIITTAALNAGKDVYCEKPLVHSVEEAVAVMAAVERNKRILQTGSMQRSMKEFRAACEIVRNGFIGEVKTVEVQFGAPGIPCDLGGEELEPGLDWDRWLGPAPQRPYSSVLSPRGFPDHFPNWRNYREFGGGMVTDWGAHHLDITQWALGMDESGPLRFTPPDNSEKATEGAQLTYAGGVVVTHRNNGFGVQIDGSEGQVQVNRGRLVITIGGDVKAKFTSKDDGTSLDREVAKLDSTLLKDPKVQLYRTANGNHLVDFLTSIKSRQKSCTHEIIGARSATVCNMTNQAYYHGKVIEWNPEALTFKDDAPGDPAWLKYSYRGEWKLG